MQHYTSADSGAERLENPATHERAWIETSAMAIGSGGTAVLFELPARAAGAPPHYHTQYDETFVVLEGELEVRSGRALAARVLRAGERITIRRGELHAFRNASDAPVTFRTLADQGLGFERFVRGWYGLGRDGRFANGGPANVLQLAMLLDAGDINLPRLPLAFQRGLRCALIFLARRSGLDAGVKRHWNARGEANQ